MGEHLIIGAGKFSHAHLRVLNELGVTGVEILKNSAWEKNQISEFTSKHSTLRLNFFSRGDNNITPEFYKNKIVHVVTPSNTHLTILDEASAAQRIFVEKPSVLYDSESDFILSRAIFNSASLIYQNDWFAGIQDIRIQKNCPTSIKFSYDVANSDPVDLITEIASHCIIFLTNWFEPDVEISIHKLQIEQDAAEISVTLNHLTTVEISVTAGRVATSFWQCSLNTDTVNEQFNSTDIRGLLLINSLNAMLTNSAFRTSWYKSSWMIHRFRMLADADSFNQQFNKFY